MLTRINFTALAMYTLLLSAGSFGASTTAKPKETDLLSGDYALNDLDTVAPFLLTTNKFDINHYLLYDSMNAATHPPVIEDPEVILLKSKLENIIFDKTESDIKFTTAKNNLLDYIIQIYQNNLIDKCKFYALLDWKDLKIEIYNKKKYLQISTTQDPNSLGSYKVESTSLKFIS
jgi:hypothetical protein